MRSRRFNRIQRKNLLLAWSTYLFVNQLDNAELSSKFYHTITAKIKNLCSSSQDYTQYVNLRGLKNANSEKACPVKFISLSDEPVTNCNNKSVVTDLTIFVDAVYRRRNLVTRNIIYTCVAGVNLH